jgi:general secretion pathway protein G
MAKKYFSGFTLVELMIVVVIIGILATIAIRSFQSQIFKGNDAKRKGDIDRIKIAVEEYEKDHNCYPLSQLVTCKPSGSGLQPYLDRIPCDPVTGASYYYEYQDSVCPGWFRVYAVLENIKDGSVTLGIGPNGAFNYVAASGNAPPTGSSTGPSASPGPTPGPTSTATPQENFYGCSKLVCVPILWDPVRGGPECDPNYQNSSCYGVCNVPANDCVSWKKKK